MNHNSILVLCFLIFCSCQSQSQKLLVDLRPVNDFSKFPIYERIMEEKEGVKSFLPQYDFMNKIDISGITYLSDGLQVKGLLVEPKEPGKYPCIIFNRGGNRDFGAVKIGTAISFLAKIAAEGYVIIASQYRGNVGGEGQEEFGGIEVNDIVNLQDVLKEIEKANPDKIGMYGWSRGGMMTYLALKRMSNIKAAVVGAGKSDLTKIDRQSMEDGVYAELIPDYWNNKEEALKERSVIYWADQLPKTTPILLLHGNADWRVDCSNSLNLALKLDELRIPYRLKIYEGADHAISEYREEVDQEVISWFDKYLKQEAKLPDMTYHGK